MNSHNSRELAESIREQVKTIAVVGASDKQHRPVYGVMRFLQNQAYRCYPVNPRLAGQEVLGETTYASLSDIPESIDMVDIFRNSDDAGAIVDEAIAVGVKVVWMQLGVVNEEAAARAEAAGLTVIMDRCPAIDWR